jgi:4-cresol dehydrogenase (hydroxylating)
MNEGKGRIADAVLSELRQIVGAEHVTGDREQIEVDSRDIGPWHTLGALIIQPGTSEEVAAVVRVANREKLPVWTFSGGWNWGYGAAMALENGAIILLLRRLNRIIEVNRELASSSPSKRNTRFTRRSMPAATSASSAASQATSGPLSSPAARA